jgi:hypothetical protein
MKPLLNSISKLNERVPVLVMVAWAALYAHRPFVMGLYHDDWWGFIETTQGTAPFTLQRLEFLLLHAFATRPVAGILAFLTTSISGSSAFRYQACAAVVVLLAALSLRGFLARLIAEHGRGRCLAADLGVVFWLSTPWSIATNSWVTCAAVQGLPAQIFFTEAARMLLLPARWTAKRTAVLSSLLAASYLCYEAFYLLIFPVAAFAILFRRPASWDKWQLGRLGMALAGSQLLAIGFNRFMSQADPSSSKTLNPEWLQLYGSSLRNLPATLSNAVAPFSTLWRMLVYLMAAAALVLLAKALRDKRLRAGAERVWGIVGLGVSWILLGTVTYSLAGYAYAGDGLTARSLLVATAAAAVLFFAAVATPFLLAPSRWAARVLLGAAFSILCLNAWAQNARLATWLTVWRLEREVLSYAPVREIQALPPEARILFVGPSYYRGLVIFGAEWDLTGAVFSLPPLSANRMAFQGLRMIHPATTMYDWTWDGATLIQILPGHFVSRFPAASLYVWDYERRRLYPAEKDFRLGASP